MSSFVGSSGPPLQNLPAMPGARTRTSAILLVVLTTCVVRLLMLSNPCTSSYLDLIWKNNGHCELSHRLHSVPIRAHSLANPKGPRTQIIGY